MISYLENGIDEVIEFTAEDPEGSDVIWDFLGGTDEEQLSPSTRQAGIRLLT